MQQPDGDFGQRGRQLRVQRDRGLQLELLGLLDERTHPVGLTALAARAAHALDHLAAAPVVHEPGRDRRAARRHFVDRRDIEIRIESHRERARDRRGAHHQLVRLAHRLAAKLQPLRDAEAVLLVDDREAQPGQEDLVLEQRVRADREHRVAAGDGRERLLARLGRQPAGEPCDLHGQAGKPERELAVVLLGENFGRRHERDLPAGLDRLQRGERRDDRLAAADVALQQSLHRHRALEVVADLPPDALLRAGELERDARQQCARQHARAGQHRRAPRGPRLPVRLERELLRDELVELEARPGRMRARIERLLRKARQARRRRMEKMHRIRKLPQMLALDNPVGQRVGGEGGIGHERPRDHLAQRFLPEARGGRVDGREPVRQRRVRRRRP